MNQNLSRIIIAFSLGILFHNFVSAQNQTQTYIFPETDSEYTVEFSEKPKVLNLVKNGATLNIASFDSSFGSILALNSNSEETINAIKKVSDETLRQQEINYANQSNIQKAEVVVGNNSLGRFVKLTGLQVLGNEVSVIESYTYYGQKSKMNLAIVIPAKSYPSANITKFLNSFKKRQATFQPVPIPFDKLNLSSIQKFVFPENSLEFTVDFPAKPNIEEVRTTDKGNFQSAGLVLNDGFLRAEYISLSQLKAAAYKEGQSDDILSQEAFRMAELAGFTNVTVSVGRNDLGRYTKMRGYKVTQGVTFAYQTHLYYGRNYCIGLTVGAPVNVFPSPSITNFLNSLKRVS